MRRSFDPKSVAEAPFRRWYVPTDVRFAVAGVLAAGWTWLAIWLSRPELAAFGRAIGTVPADVIAALVAFVPGYLVAFHAIGLLFDRPPALLGLHPATPVTVLIAARNEERTIAETLDYLAAQDYDGELSIVLIDNGSTDGTVIEALKAVGRNGAPLVVLRENRAGKSFALNRGLATVRTPLVVTVAAGTLLQKSAIRLLVARLDTARNDVTAIAGHLMVRNGREGIWARLQVWDYLLSISALKRVQAMFQGTLVAQGAFSLYRTNALRRAGGWPMSIGEDVVLTWRLLLGGRVSYEPLALGFTSVPTGLRDLARQRSRWARGLFEGLSAVPPWWQYRWTIRLLAGVDLLIPLLDLAYVAAWLPAVALAATGRFWILGPVATAVAPATLLLYGVLYRRQRRTVLEPLGLRARRDRTSLLLFLVAFQPVLSVLSVRGYAEHLLRRRAVWK
jgi:biofilm PGA synthesis N-glycosyltransferase PgaC